MIVFFVSSSGSETWPPEVSDLMHMAIKRESSIRSAFNRSVSGTSPGPDTVMGGGGLVPTVFKNINPDQEHLCRQTIRPQCNLSLKVRG